MIIDSLPVVLFLQANRHDQVVQEVPVHLAHLDHLDHLFGLRIPAYHKVPFLNTLNSDILEFHVWDDDDDDNANKTAQSHLVYYN